MKKPASDGLTSFVWTVSTTGYEWRVARAVGLTVSTRSRFLTDSFPIEVVRHISRYNPLLSCSGLFRIFALETEPTEDGIVQFANKYGLLGGNASKGILLKAHTELGCGETLADWLAEIQEMQDLVKLWDAARKPHISLLMKCIRWDELRTSVEYSLDRGRTGETIASSVIHPQVLAMIKPGDVIAPAYWLLQSRINKKLTQHGVAGRLLWKPDMSSFTVHLVPNSLAGCLWLQFAKAIEGNKNHRQCDNCKLWFELGGSREARADKKFCTPNCKAAWNRNKPKEGSK